MMTMMMMMMMVMVMVMMRRRRRDDDDDADAEEEEDEDDDDDDDDHHALLQSGAQNVLGFASVSCLVFSDSLKHQWDPKFRSGTWTSAYCFLENCSSRLHTFLPVCAFALPKNEQPGSLNTLVLGSIKVNNFCCFILTPLAGCGAHAEGVPAGALDEESRAWCFQALFQALVPLGPTWPVVLPCQMTARRWAKVLAGGACGRALRAWQGRPNSKQIALSDSLFVPFW